MAKFDKDFFDFEANLLEKDDEFVTLSINNEKIVLAKNLFPKSLEKEKEIKIVLASKESYKNRLEKRAKEILNEILGS